MKNSQAYLVLLSLMLFAFHHTSSAVVPTYRIRPQGINRPRELIGLTNVLYHHDTIADQWSGNLYTAPFFSQSMKPHQIGKALFGCDTIPCDDRFIIKIQGVDYQGDDRDPRAWLADNFFLNTGFSSEISFKPVIKNTGLDIGFYLDLDKYVSNSYFRIHAPLVHSNWNLHFRERVINPGGYNAPIGLLSPVDIQTIGAFLFQSFTQYATGTALNSSVPMLEFAQINSCDHSTTKLADLTLEYGCKVWKNEHAFLNLYAQLVIPTGTKRDSAKLLFSPQVGNDHHWGVGFGASGQYHVWENETHNKKLTFNADIGLSHLFTNTQMRTFDLKDKPMSRYMLASHFIQDPSTISIPGAYLRGFPSLPVRFADIFPIIEGNGAQANGVYFYTPISFLPVADLTTTDVRVSIGIQADIVAYFNYTHNNWSYDVGYNFWAQSCEHIKVCSRDWENGCTQYVTLPTLFDTPNPLFAFALKGDARIWGFESSNPTILSATESKADIHNGTNKIPIGLTPNLAYNQNVDNALPGTINNGTDAVTILSGSPVQVYTSIQPVLLSCDDVDVSGNRGISNKLFAHASRSWPQEHYIPFLGLGGEVEWGSVGASKCAGCKNAALSQWSMWFKGGISFN